MSEFRKGDRVKIMATVTGIDMLGRPVVQPDGFDTRKAVFGPCLELVEHTKPKVGDLVPGDVARELPPGTALKWEHGSGAFIIADGGGVRTASSPSGSGLPSRRENYVILHLPE